MMLGRRGLLRTVLPNIAPNSGRRQQNEEEVLFVGGMHELAGSEGKRIGKKKSAN